MVLEKNELHCGICKQGGLVAPFDPRPFQDVYRKVDDPFSRFHPRVVAEPWREEPKEDSFEFLSELAGIYDEE